MDYNKFISFALLILILLHPLTFAWAQSAGIRSPDISALTTKYLDQTDGMSADKAVAIAKAVKGVTSVENHITIKADK